MGTRSTGGQGGADAFRGTPLGRFGQLKATLVECKHNRTPCSPCQIRSFAPCSSPPARPLQTCSATDHPPTYPSFLFGTPTSLSSSPRSRRFDLGVVALANLLHRVTHSGLTKWKMMCPPKRRLAVARSHAREVEGMGLLVFEVFRLMRARGGQGW
jgi:hypothetical protein